MGSLSTDLIFWLLLPGIVAAGTALLVWLLMQARIQVLAGNYQAALARVENDSGARQPSLDDLLAHLRFERRRFLRRIPGLEGYDTTVITQERIYFGNIPITGWMQEDLQLGEGTELGAETCSLPAVSTLVPATRS